LHQFPKGISILSLFSRNLDPNQGLSCCMFWTCGCDCEYCGNKSQPCFLSRPSHWIQRRDVRQLLLNTSLIGSCKFIDSRIFHHLHQGLVSGISIFFRHFPSNCINFPWFLHDFPGIPTCHGMPSVT
jgi:hypothetical protein